MSRPSAARDWCFTINHPQPYHVKHLWNLDYGYIAWQVEVGEEGTPHIQGFVQFREKQRLTAIIEMMVGGDEQQNSGHWSKRRGTPEEASHYCLKPVERACGAPLTDGCQCKHCKGLERFDNVSFEEGSMSMDPQTELKTVCSVLKAKGLTHTIERFPSVYVKFNHGIDKLSNRYTQRRDFKTQVTVLWGVPGSGKTRYAMEAFPSPYKLCVSGGKGQTDFFGDYHPDHHQTVVVDDFYGNWRYTTFLQVADRYATEVHTKGGFLQFLGSHLVITSNVTPHEWYPNVLAHPDRVESFDRRLDNIIRFHKLGYTIVKVRTPLITREVFHFLLLAG